MASLHSYADCFWCRAQLWSVAWRLASRYTHPQDAFAALPLRRKSASFSFCDTFLYYPAGLAPGYWSTGARSCWACANNRQACWAADCSSSWHLCLEHSEAAPPGPGSFPPETAISWLRNGDGTDICPLDLDWTVLLVGRPNHIPWLRLGTPRRESTCSLADCSCIKQMDLANLKFENDSH